MRFSWTDWRGSAWLARVVEENRHGRRVGGWCMAYMRWAEDGAVPVGHEEVVALVQAVGTCLYSSN